jgi:hypothetical protein
MGIATNGLDLYGQEALVHGEIIVLIPEITSVALYTLNMAMYGSTTAPSCTLTDMNLIMLDVRIYYNTTTPSKGWSNGTTLYESEAPQVATSQTGWLCDTDAMAAADLRALADVTPPPPPLPRAAFSVQSPAVRLGSSRLPSMFETKLSPLIVTKSSR